MAVYTFGAAPVLIESTGEFAIGATGVLRATEGGSPVPVYDLNDSPIPGVIVGPRGAHQAFKADIPDGVLDFGSTQIITISVESIRAGLTAVESAESALSQVQTLQNSKAAVIHTHTPADLEAATGTPSATTFYRGDGAWAVPAGGGGGTGFIDGGTASSTFSDTIIDGGSA